MKQKKVIKDSEIQRWHKEKKKNIHRIYKNGKVRRLLERNLYRRNKNEGILARETKKRFGREKAKRNKNEAKVWKFIRREAKDWKENHINKEEWMSHFLSRRNEYRKGEGNRKIKKKKGRRKMKEKKKGRVEELEEEKNLTNSKKNKEEKSGWDKWNINGDVEVIAIRKEFVEFMKQIWRGDIPKEWKINVITSICKKGTQKKTKNYRGMLFLYSAYNIYIEFILRKRMKIEREGKNLISES